VSGQCLDSVGWCLLVSRGVWTVSVGVCKCLGVSGQCQDSLLVSVSVFGCLDNVYIVYVGVCYCLGVSG
jgi:hypothetical protein